LCFLVIRLTLNFANICKLKGNLRLHFCISITLLTLFT
jgi:hypothetical protein